MNKKQLKEIRSGYLLGSTSHKREYLDFVMPIIRKYSGKNGKITPAVKRRIRVMKLMALEILYYNKFVNNEAPVNYLSKLFAEIYSGNNEIKSVA